MPNLNDIMEMMDALETKAIITTPTFCVAVRNRHSSCRKCVDACLADAITIEKNELNIDAGACVACGACVEACRFGAVQINDLGCAEVDEEKCIGCGACARKCPRGLIDLRRTEDRIAVLCSNRDKGFDPATKTGARTVCDVSCIGCGLCVKKCPADAIHVVEFRAVIDYERCLSCGACGDVCPRHAIRDRFGIITEKR